MASSLQDGSLSPSEHRRPSLSAGRYSSSEDRRPSLTRGDIQDPKTHVPKPKPPPPVFTGPRPAWALCWPRDVIHAWANTRPRQVPDHVYCLRWLLTGEHIANAWFPGWYRIEQVVFDLEECIIPHVKLEPTDGGRRYYKILWGDIELKEKENLSDFVEAHGIPTDTPVVLKVYAGYSPRDV